MEMERSVSKNCNDVGKRRPSKDDEVIDMVEERQPDSDSGRFDNAKMFKRLPGQTDKNNNNHKVECAICGWIGWQSHADGHIANKHSSRLAEYRELKGKTQQPTLNFDKKKPLSLAQSEEIRKLEGTLANLEKQIARFVVLRRLPLDVANSPELFSVVRTAMNVGLALHEKELQNFAIPTRNTLIDRVIEGESGLLVDYVDNACKVLEPLVQDSAPSIIYDGAKDANGHSLELFCLQAGNKVILLWTGLPHITSKSHEWTHDCLKGLLDGNMDFEIMDVNGEEPVDESKNIAGTLANAGNENKASKKRRKTDLIPQLSRLFQFSRWVSAVGGDNASTPLSAAKLLSKTQGVLYFGCVAHAFSRCYQHVCEVPAINAAIVSKIEAIADTFLSYSQPREILRKFSKGKSVYRIVPTRFITVYLAGNRLLHLKDALCDSVSEPQFRDFVRSAGKQAKLVANIALEAIQSEDFWKFLDFFLKMSIGFVVAVRCFDGALQGSVCLVYQFWSTLSQTVVGVFKEHRKSCPSFATSELYDDVKKVIMTDWNKFLYPVYCAAYFLCPYYVNQVRYYQSNYSTWFKTLFEHTLDCCITVFRRFEMTGKPRETVLLSDDVSLVQMRKTFTDELLDYVKMRGNFNARMFSDGLRAPTDWWDIEASTSTLSHIATKIVSISPSTAPVERLHKLTKSIRTKSRNSISYARALGLNFICAEEIMKNCKSVKFSWNELENYKVRFKNLSKPEEEYLEELAEEQAKAQASQNDDELTVSVEDVVDAQLSHVMADTGGSSVEQSDLGGDLKEQEAFPEVVLDGLSSELMFSDSVEQ